MDAGTDTKLTMGEVLDQQIQGFLDSGISPAHAGRHALPADPQRIARNPGYATNGKSDLRGRVVVIDPWRR
jgi:hypothetical protein